MDLRVTSMDRMPYFSYSTKSIVGPITYSNMAVCVVLSKLERTQSNFYLHINTG